MAAEFDEARAKLDHAREHADRLSEEGLALLGPELEQPITWTTTFNADDNCFDVSIASVREPPRRLGLILGDAVNNFRAALDHVAWRLAEHGRQGATPRSRARFPIVNSSAAFRRAEVQDAMRQIDVTHVEMIERLQPYRQIFTNDVLHPLAALRAMSNRDRYRLLDVVLNPADLEISVSGVPQGCRVIALDLNAEAVAKPPVAGLRVARYYADSTTGVPQIALKLGGSGYLAVDGVVSVDDRLERIGRCVEEVIETFESALRDGADIGGPTAERDSSEDVRPPARRPSPRLRVAPAPIEPSPGLRPGRSLSS
jgi:hypothetical protein